MSKSPKVHNKLRTSKNASVSMDSLLGLLSSAYGTEELDPSVIFQKNTVNWRNLSVENFKIGCKKVDTEEDKEKKLKPKELKKINNATSTTSLKQEKRVGSEIDVTLLSIRSLADLKIEDSKPEMDQTVDRVSEDSKEQTGERTDPPKVGSEVAEVPKPPRPICGFRVNDSDRNIIFDIRFTKKVVQNEMISAFDIDGPEICIDVTDNAKQSKESVNVAIRNLVAKSQYFCDVDKAFTLENLVATVICNLSVFQWIVQWVNADLEMCKPCLNPKTLKLILSTAYHLAIHQLVDQCLDYFYHNCGAVLETDCTIEEVIDDSLSLRLVERFSNSEINDIKEQFGHFKMKMFCALIARLADRHHCSKVGHYSTLATLFQCRSCEKLLVPELLDTVPCSDDSNLLSVVGQLVPHHERSPSWNLSRYIELMHEQLKSWQTVYWRLWGTCHFLRCDQCHSLYPLGQSEQCPYHPEEVEYFPMTPTTDYPIGTFQCCGQVAFRFNVLPPADGCRFRSHTPQIISREDASVINIYERHRALIEDRPPRPEVVKVFTKLVKDDLDSEAMQNESPEKSWRHGVRLAPTEREDYSIIPTRILRKLRNKPAERKVEETCKPLTYGPPVHLGTVPSSLAIASNKGGTGTGHSRKARPKPPAKKTNYFLNTVSSTRSKAKRIKSSLYQPAESLWHTAETNKDNQDVQRDFEEDAMRTLVKMLTPEEHAGFSTEPTAGSYVRIESEWYQERNADPRAPGTTRTSGTVINRTYPLSWYRKLTI